MIVEIIRDHPSNKYPKVGEFYKAKAYHLDPSKVTLLHKVDPITFVKLEHQHAPEPLCNEYRCNIKIVAGSNPIEQHDLTQPEPLPVASVMYRSAKLMGFDYFERWYSQFLPKK